MKEIEPQFDSEVVFLAVDVGYDRDLKDIHAFAQQAGNSWSVGAACKGSLLALDVKVQ